MIMKANKQIGFIYKDNESIDRILKDGEVVFERGFLREKTSTTLPITFGGVGKDLKDYKIYGNTVQSKLPSGYTQVDYIKSSGNQYIDTGVNADSNLSIKMNLSSDYHIQQRHMGAIKNDNGVYTRHHITLNDSTTTNYIASFTGRTNSAQNLLSTIDDNKHYLNLDIYNKKVSVDEETPIDLTLQPFDTELNYWLFARNSNNSTNMSFAIMQIYDCKMYYSDVLVRDFIPCYRNSDNEVGLYDLVNNVFYTNQGTGSFTYGNMAPTPDAPIEMVSCGDRTKNLFDKNNANIINGYIQGNTGKIILGNSDLIAYIKCKPNTQYSFQRMQIIDNKGRLRIGTTQTIPIADMAVENFYYKGNSEYSTNKLDGYTTGANAEYLLFYFSQISGMSQDEIDTILGSIQIEENPIATEYESYYDGYKIPVNVRSENLFDINTITPNTYITNAGATGSSSVSNLLDYIPVYKNKPIIVSYDYDTLVNTTNRSLVFYDTNKNYISGQYYSPVSKKQQFIPEQDGYIRFAYDKNCTNIYISYYNETTNIYLDEPLRKIDGYNDYIDFANGKIVRKIKEIILDGSLSNNFNNPTINNNTIRFDIQNILLGSLRSNQNKIICDKFISLYGNNNDYEHIRNTNTSYNNVLIVYINKIRLNLYTREEFINWLSSNPVTVDYVLETPTEEDIELPNIPTIDGNNTLNIETEITPSQVYIKYKSNS